jgi:hypothetical protein
LHDGERLRLLDLAGGRERWTPVRNGGAIALEGVKEAPLVDAERTAPAWLTSTGAWPPSAVTTAFSPIARSARRAPCSIRTRR